MLTENDDIAEIKNVVLQEVARHTFAGDLSEKLDVLPYELIPGPQAKFRCCIYKEREIVRQRIRLAQGKSPTRDRDNKNIVQVINSACEGCPITRFVVTDNCQKCMGKRCQQACRFGAITMLRDRAYIDSSKCKECGKCSSACPYNAIADLLRPCKRSCPMDAISMDENNIVVIDEEKCINCGSCIKDCPFGAISDRSFIVDVIKLIRDNRPVYAMVAPAAEGQFGAGITMGMLSEGIKALGFTDMYEVALGADLTAAAEAAEWFEAYEEGKKKTTSCCPSFVKIVRKHFPKLVEHVSETLSPMNLLARHIKERHPDAVTVFIGPCIAKKGEVLDTITLGAADYALTFDELYAMLKAQEVDLKSFGSNKQDGSIYGKRFAQSGGVTAAVIQALKENDKASDMTIRQCDGAAECKKALLLLSNGRLPEDFIEGMSCIGGCVNGPGSIATGAQVLKAREALLKNADGRGIYENLKAHQNV